MIKSNKIGVEELDGKGISPLHFAVDCGFPLSICKQLVEEYKCNVNTKDNDGNTLLHFAVWNDNEELESWLVDDIAMSKKVKNNDGLTPYDD